MTSSLLKQPITESLEITLHIATYHPKLLPEQHRSTISALLEEAKERLGSFSSVFEFAYRMRALGSSARRLPERWMRIACRSSRV
jgi:glutathione S-transferase